MMGGPTIRVLLFDDDQAMLDLWGYLFSTLGIEKFWAPLAEMRKASPLPVDKADRTLVFTPKDARWLPGRTTIQSINPVVSGRTLCVFGPTHDHLTQPMLDIEGVEPDEFVYLPSVAGTDLHAPMAGAIALWHLMQVAHG